jgi:hypothetical protein
MAESGAIVARSFLWKDLAWVKSTGTALPARSCPWFF